MVNKCSVTGCRSLYTKDKTNIKLHRFPLTNPKTLPIWIAATGREMDWKPSKSSRLCGNHFQESEYIIGHGKGVLKSTAIPTIEFHINIPKYNKKKLPCLYGDIKQMNKQNQVESMVQDNLTNIEIVQFDYDDINNSKDEYLNKDETDNHEELYIKNKSEVQNEPIIKIEHVENELEESIECEVNSLQEIKIEPEEIDDENYTIEPEEIDNENNTNEPEEIDNENNTNEPEEINNENYTNEPEEINNENYTNEPEVKNNENGKNEPEVKNNENKNTISNNFENDCDIIFDKTLKEEWNIQRFDSEIQSACNRDNQCYVITSNAKKLKRSILLQTAVQTPLEVGNLHQGPSTWVQVNETIDTESNFQKIINLNNEKRSKEIYALYFKTMQKKSTHKQGNHTITSTDAISFGADIADQMIELHSHKKIYMDTKHKIQKILMKAQLEVNNLKKRK